MCPRSSLLGDPAIVEPAPAVAHDFMTVLDKGAGELGIHFKTADHAHHADLDVESPEDAQQAPTSDAGPVLEHQFDHRAPLSLVGREADVGEQVLGMLVAFEDRMFAAGLDIQIQVHRNTRPARPASLRKLFTVTAEISSRTQIRGRDLPGSGSSGAGAEHDDFGKPAALLPSQRGAEALPCELYSAPRSYLCE